ncbi:MAG TPA: hypothetical protein VLT16_10375, partial [Candidatus Limnocylindrales bacterium]|nr:hypothetical protein [Candidatus Limnocylindrales bacterium]
MTASTGISEASSYATKLTPILDRAIPLPDPLPHTWKQKSKALLLGVLIGIGLSLLLIYGR